MSRSTTTSRRPSNPDIELQRLEQRHQQLKERVAEFESRPSLSSKEQFTLAKLKKEKLATKDAMQRLV